MKTVALFLAALGLSAHALPTKPGIPSELVPWIPWVMHGQEEKLCPTPYNQADQHHCFLPSRLDLKVTRSQAQFQQQWSLLREGWVPLPGGESQWPVDVRVGGKPSLVIPKDGAPHLFLPAGNHNLTGQFLWSSLPEGLTTPPKTGIVTLTLNGAAVPFPNVDASGKVWLQKPAEASEQEGNHTEIKVNRLIIDEIPLQLQTRVELQVSGEARPMELGPVLPEGFTPMAIEGELPATLQPNGLLKVQIRPGRWTVTVTARHEGPTKELGLGQPVGGWPAEEVWAFEAKNHLRLVTIEGVPGVDPLQTTLPEDWKKFPAFLVTAKDKLKLVEKRRGDADPTADQLHLRRTLWLDFDGRGYSIEDHIQGNVKRAWRLEAAAPMELGRAAVGGENQLITRRTEGGPAGIEIRDGALKVEAEGRIPRRSIHLPTTGWSQDFQSVSASLHLPPGWRALAITGVDRSTGTWFSFWNLGNLFLVVLLTLAAGKLKGFRWGAVAAVGLALAFPERGSPQIFWLAALLAVVLYRVIPEGRFQRAAGWARNVCLLVLTGIVLTFVVQQVKQAIYPVLEKPRESVTAYQPAEPDFSILNRTEPSQMPQNSAPPMGAAGGVDEAGEVAREEIGADYDTNVQSYGNVRSKGKARIMKQALKEGRSVFSPLSNTNLGQKIAQYDPNAIVQVGPGLPRWSWNRADLFWSGPVSQSEQIGVWLLSPWVNRLLALLRSVAVAALLGLILKEACGGRLPRLGRPVDRLVALALAPALLLVSSPASAGDLPTKEILGELRDRMLEPSKCFPHCAAVNRLAVEYAADALTVRLEITAAVSATVPVPGNSRHWLPDTVLVDGKPAAGLLRDESGTLWTHVTEGSHQISLRGRLPNRDSVQIPLPMTAHNVSARGTGWTLEGLHKDGQAEANLELRRIRRERGQNADGLEASNLPPFVLIERELGLGLSWTARTRIVRLTPVGSAVVLSVPLLPGESVTTPGVRVDKGKALVNIPPRSSEAIWDSVLEMKSPVTLKAPETASWTEIWRLDASPIWSVALAGISVVFHHNDQGRKMPLWRPWPGEEVKITVDRPAAISGQTLSIGKSRLTVAPGTRATDATLTFNVRSSRGGEHTLTLPAGSELQKLTIAGRAQPVRPEGDKLVLPVTPGSQDIEVGLRLKGGISPFFRNPAFNLGAKSVNSSLQISMPHSRWILFAGGPGAGPAVLIWGELIVILLIAIALGRSLLTPLRAWEWALLGIGLTQCRMWDQFLVVGLLLALGWRRRNAKSFGRRTFNATQLGLIVLALAAAGSLLLVMERGFFGNPEMHVAGNGSYFRHLEWFADRLDGPLPTPWVLSLPLLAYRLTMLAWALWLAASLLKWVKWGWGSFAEGGLWRSKSSLIKGS